MQLLDRADSPGLLVRPRPGRLELGGEYLAGARLRAALAFAVGSAALCEEAARGGGFGRLPRAVRLRVEPGYERYGWFVDRAAPGTDLLELARRARLPLAGGGEISAQEHLEEAWRCARPLARAAGADHADLERLDRTVAGELPLPSEWEESDERPSATVPPHPFGAAVRSRDRSDYELAPVMIHWSLCVFLVRAKASGRVAYASVPRLALQPFLGGLDDGALDDALGSYLATRPAGRCLKRLADAEKAGLWDAIGPRHELLAPERDPQRGQARLAA
jgi:hypothetical protein